MLHSGKKSISISSPLVTAVKWSFVVFVFLPLIYTFFTAFTGEGKLFANLKQLDAGTFFLLLKSGGISLSIALLSTFFGTFLGFLLYKTNIQFKGFFKVVILVPLFLSPYILAVAWKDLFFLAFKNTDIIASYGGVILVLTTIYTPLSTLVTGNAFMGIDAGIEESALMISPFRKVFFKVILPLIKPALLSSFVLIFIFSISEFSVPAFFGVKVFTTEIFTRFSAFYNHALAVLQSSLLILICVLLLLGERNYLAEAPFFSISSKGTRTRIYHSRKYMRIFLFVLLFWIFISVALPFIVLFIQAFKGGTSHFIKAFELLKPTFSTSFGLAFTGAVITLFIGFAAAYRYMSNTGAGSGNYFDLVLLITFATPSIILGISLIKFYNHPSLNFIYSSFAIIVIGYVGKYSFIAAKLISNAVRQIPKSLDEAARIAGISSFMRVWKIFIPILSPALFGAFIISFIFNLGELGTTIMVYPPGTEIMPIKVYTIMANAPQALTSSMTLIVFSVTLALIGGFYFIGKRSMRKKHTGNMAI